MPAAGALADRLATLPRSPGVYRFRDARGRVLYVGRAAELRSRVRSYWGDLRDRPHLRRMARRIAAVDVLECASEHEAAFVERRLLEASCPPYNWIVADSVEAYLRYDDGTGLAFARDSDPQARSFGPYLGSTPARHAAQALNFLFPVAHALGGSSRVARELGRSRGFGAADAPTLRAELFAVLERDPRAVAGAIDRLVASRDAASATTAFEGAARVQAQIAGISWITQPVAPERVERLVRDWRPQEVDAARR